MRLPTHALPRRLAAFMAGWVIYRNARDAHALTLNTEAPFPAEEIYRVMYERMVKGENIFIHDTGDFDAPPPLDQTLDFRDIDWSTRPVLQTILGR